MIPEYKHFFVFRETRQGLISLYDVTTLNGRKVYIGLEGIYTNVLRMYESVTIKRVVFDPTRPLRRSDNLFDLTIL